MYCFVFSLSSSGVRLNAWYIACPGVESAYLRSAVSLDELVKLRVLRRNGDGETGGKDARRHAAELVRREGLLHLPGELEVLEDGGRVEQLVARLPEHQGQLLIVVGHHLGLKHLLGHGHEAVDVLDGLVGLLPELHLDGSVQLGKTSVQVHLLGVSIVQVDGHLGRGLLLHQIQVVAQLVAKFAELGFPLQKM